jgi:hypothetical protein
MNFLLFVLEILFVVTVIALVPTLSELRICCAREGHKAREQGNCRRS